MMGSSSSVSNLKFIGIIFILSFLAACASGGGHSVKVTEDDVAKFNLMSAEEVVSSLEKSLQEAREQNLPFYTPGFFKDAESIHKDVKQGLGKKKSKDDIIREVAKAERLLSQAKIKKKDIEAELGDLLTINDSLIKLDAPKIFDKEYKSVSNDLSDLIEKIEKNKTDKLEKGKVKVLKRLVDLEVKSIKYDSLHEAELINAHAKVKNAAKLARAIYTEAIETYQKSEIQIEQHPHDKEKVAEAKSQALFSARHALNVTDRVISLEAEFKKSPESVIVAEEWRLLDVSQAINKADYRDKSISEQVSEIVGSINKLNADIAAVSKNAEKIAGMEKQLKEKEDALSVANKELEKVKAELVESSKKAEKIAANLSQLQSKEKELSAQLMNSKVAPVQPVSSESVIPAIEEVTTPESGDGGTVKNNP